MAPREIGRVRLNERPLVRFLSEGQHWTIDEMKAFVDRPKDALNRQES
jgi:hypothetical protein